MRKFREILAGGDKGFTLIELLVVIAVLGILAGIAIPRLGGVTEQARLAEATSIVGSVRTALELYYVQNNNSYTTHTTELEEYIDEGLDNSNWSIDITVDGASYTITVNGNDADNGYPSRLEASFTKGDSQVETTRNAS